MCTFEDDDNSCFLREDINDDFNWTRNKVNELILIVFLFLS